MTKDEMVIGLADAGYIVEKTTQASHPDIKKILKAIDNAIAFINRRK